MNPRATGRMTHGLLRQGLYILNGSHGKMTRYLCFMPCFTVSSCQKFQA